MKVALIKSLIFTGVLMLAVAPIVEAGNKKIMSVMAAKVIAERAIVESVYGLKLRATEEVQDMVAASFQGKTESKTAALMSGIKFEEVTYDAQKDIAKATATVQLDEITNIDGNTVNLNNKVFKRVGFATSTPSQAGPLRALRAAELDAYKQLIKHVVGFNLESNTSVENFILKSDTVKTKVLATVFLAELIEYGWDEAGDAFVKLKLNVSEVSELLGDKVVGAQAEVVEVEGLGTQTDDFAKSTT